MSYQQLLQEDRRLVILRLLAESQGYTANIYLLSAALPGFGHAISHDGLRAELAWLDEQALISVSKVSDVEVAKLTPRGNDVAHGRARCPGVKRPEPEA
ncbi:ArsR family transcriptional regulator [Alkalilimnicola sp. S0819]|uniref:VpaChn25_0724 family phage protein n=1 Tax=Alkalilimnicola sp. S0819 TaxID=2613922 RepID=UPI00126150DF|nr:ArsR family transcriptional regulator [Alkalilimnicola sp. S0819]KAB7624337.1 ArsR family transcriptional regulator [Alkalilimnicola sp. S0819]MPQ16162.1 ArsR family transcriptional regulator [Alkalilimnicola sp. S0819]